MKKPNKKKPNKKKRVLLSVTAVMLVLAVGVGIFLIAPGSAEPVGVYPFDYLGMTEYWGDTQESYGPVTSDNIQTVFLTDTQIVTEIKVKEGDTVKKGDVLMTFDTTLSSLSLERKRLDVEKKKLNLEIAQRELGDILMMEPMEEPEYTQPAEDEEEVDLGTVLTNACLLSDNSDYDGSSEEKALICWLKVTTTVDESLLEEIRYRAERIQRENAEKEKEEKEKTSWASALPENATEETGSAETETEAEEEKTPLPTDWVDKIGLDDWLDILFPGNGNYPGVDDDTTAPDDTEEDEEEETVTVDEFYVVFKTTQDNMSLGTRLTWVGMHVRKNSDGSFRYRFYDASAFADYTIETEQEETSTVLPDIDYGSGYTLAQIVQMKAAKQKEIQELEFNLRMAETEYKIMQRELEDGNVYAEVDGDVVTVLSEEEARATRQSIIKVSGGGGFYVECSVSELEKEKMEIGMEVTVNDWNTGMTYTGTVESIGDFPDADGDWNGMGNPNTTYYPFTVFIDGSADLQTRSYVSVMYSTASSEHGIYLENPFIRTEQGKSCVYVLGAGGKLEKRDVVTGKSLWGSYTEILSGITEDDLIAFPYGKNVKEGAPAEERDISELYSY